MRKKLKDDAFFIKTISKVVVSATENSLMPLVQLSLMFPKMLFWFQKVPENHSLKDCFESSNYNFTDPENRDKITECIENLEISWVFAFTIASIVTSLFSMASTLTMTYFSKPGRNTWIKHPSKFIVYFISIIFQVVPRILAYEAFAFGVMGKLMPDLIIPCLLMLPLLMASLRSIVYGVYIRLSKSRRDITKSDRPWASLLFGLSSIYSFNEHYFYSDDEKNKRLVDIPKEQDVEYGNSSSGDTGENIILEGTIEEEEELEAIHFADDFDPPRQIVTMNVQDETISSPIKKQFEERKRKNIQWCHITYDALSTVENIGLASAGAFNILDENFDPIYFVIILCILQILGLTSKAAYYLFLHPWEKLHPQLKTCQYAFLGLISLLITAIIVTIIYYGAMTMRILVGCIVGVAFIILFIWIVGSGKMASCHSSFSKLNKSLKKGIQTKWSTFKEEIQSKWSTFKEGIQSKWSTFKDGIQSTGSRIGQNFRQIARNVRQSQLCPRNYRRVPNNDTTTVDHHPEDIEMNQNTTNEFAHDPEEVESLNATVSTNLSVSNIESV